ncbi:MAG: hypothetical protein R2762_21360 [Bryobacteraceae bacterium]
MDPLARGHPSRVQIAHRAHHQTSVVGGGAGFHTILRWSVPVDGGQRELGSGTEARGDTRNLESVGGSMGRALPAGEEFSFD